MHGFLLMNSLGNGGKKTGNIEPPPRRSYRPPPDASRNHGVEFTDDSPDGRTLRVPNRLGVYNTGRGYRQTPGAPRNVR